MASPDTCCLQGNTQRFHVFGSKPTRTSWVSKLRVNRALHFAVVFPKWDSGDQCAKQAGKSSQSVDGKDESYFGETNIHELQRLSVESTSFLFAWDSVHDSLTHLIYIICAISYNVESFWKLLINPFLHRFQVMKMCLCTHSRFFKTSMNWWPAEERHYQSWINRFSAGSTRQKYDTNRSRLTDSQHADFRENWMTQ